MVESHTPLKRGFSRQSKQCLLRWKVLENIEIDEQTFFVIKRLNYSYNLILLIQIIYFEAHYIAKLGTKTKLDRMLDDLKKQGVLLGQEEVDKLDGSIGLDIEAETSEEITLSIVFKIQKVLTGKPSNSLKYLTEKTNIGTYSF